MFLWSLIEPIIPQTQSNTEDVEAETETGDREGKVDDCNCIPDLTSFICPTESCMLYMVFFTKRRVRSASWLQRLKMLCRKANTSPQLHTYSRIYKTIYIQTIKSSPFTLSAKTIRICALTSQYSLSKYIKYITLQYFIFYLFTQSQLLRIADLSQKTSGWQPNPSQCPAGFQPCPPPA